MELNCILWYCIVSYGIELYLMVLHWYCMVFHCIAWYCMVLQDVALYCTVSHCIILNLTILHGIALYHCWLRRAGCISQDTYLLYLVFGVVYFGYASVEAHQSPSGHIWQGLGDVKHEDIFCS